MAGERVGRVREPVSRVWLNNIDCFKKVKIVDGIVGPFDELARGAQTLQRHRPLKNKT